MEIHQLEYFLAVEKYRNFSAASLEICISQSNLSQQIKKLEDELGVKLFIRYPRSVRLTPAGKDFLVHARKIVSEIKLSRETVQKYINLDKGYIKIGVIPHISYLGLDKIIVNFIKSYPGIEVDIHTAHTDELLKGLREKKFNVAFINTPYTVDYEIDFHPLTNDEIVLLVSKAHPLANESIADLGDLSQEKFLMLDSSSWFQNALIRACNEAGYEPKFALECGHIDMVRSLVENGIGIALMENRMAQSISNSATSIVPIKQKLERQSGLAIPTYAFSRLPLATSLFRNFTLKEIPNELNKSKNEHAPGSRV